MQDRADSKTPVVDLSSKANAVLPNDNKLWLVTACNSGYFIAYAPALIESCIRLGANLVLTVIEPGERDQKLLEFLQSSHFWDKGIFVAESCPTDVVHKPAYYASHRFRVAHSLLRTGFMNRALVIDVDSYLMRPIPTDFEQYDLGLWLREQEPELGMQCLAGCSMFTKASLPVLERMLTIVDNIGYDEHFTDQLALYSAYKQWVDDPLHWRWFDREEKPIPKVIDFAKWGPLIDWDFTDRGIIWTGKGPRKNTVIKYMTEQNRLTVAFIKRAFAQGWTIA